jgi:hypothetical protein
MPAKREGAATAYRREFVDRAINKGVLSIRDLTHDLLLDAYNLGRSESKCAKRSAYILGSDSGSASDDSEVVFRRSKKGKQRADPDVCDKDGCSHDPKCLNWLGQTEWQDRGTVCIPVV